jgi:hypothetical protein
VLPTGPLLPTKAGKFDHARNGPWLARTAPARGGRVVALGKHTRLIPHPSRHQPRYWPYLRRGLVGADGFHDVVFVDDAGARAGAEFRTSQISGSLDQLFSRFFGLSRFNCGLHILLLLRGR